MQLLLNDAAHTETLMLCGKLQGFLEYQDTAHWVLQSFYVQCNAYRSVQVLVDVMQALEKQFKN
jgi:hypothetical protein